MIDTSIAGWREATGAAAARSPYLQFALCLAFAGDLARAWGIPTFTTHLHCPRNVVTGLVEELARSVHPPHHAAARAWPARVEGMPLAAPMLLDPGFTVLRLRANEGTRDALQSIREIRDTRPINGDRHSGMILSVGTAPLLPGVVVGPPDSQRTASLMDVDIAADDPLLRASDVDLYELLGDVARHRCPDVVAEWRGWLLDHAPELLPLPRFGDGRSVVGPQLTRAAETVMLAMVAGMQTTLLGLTSWSPKQAVDACTLVGTQLARQHAMVELIDGSGSASRTVH